MKKILIILTLVSIILLTGCTDGVTTQQEQQQQQIASQQSEPQITVDTYPLENDNFIDENNTVDIGTII